LSFTGEDAEGIVQVVYTSHRKGEKFVFPEHKMAGHQTVAIGTPLEDDLLRVGVKLKSGVMVSFVRDLVVKKNGVGKKLKFQNWSRRRKGSNYWNWGIYVVASEEALAGIRSVVYTLHPSFPNNIRAVHRKGDGKYPFELKTAGWGTFTIRVRVFFKDSSFQEFDHHLKFE